MASIQSCTANDITEEALDEGARFIAAASTEKYYLYRSTVGFKPFCINGPLTGETHESFAHAKKSYLKHIGSSTIQKETP